MIQMRTILEVADNSGATRISCIHTRGGSINFYGGIEELITANVKEAILEGVNFVRKHTKANPQKNIKGGILERESPVDLSNLMPVCGECGKPTRVGHKFLDDGKKVRVCRRCGGLLDK